MALESDAERRDRLAGIVYGITHEESDTLEDARRRSDARNLEWPSPTVEPAYRIVDALMQALALPSGGAVNKGITDADLVAAMTSGGPAARARQVFSSRAAGLEQAGMQRKPPSVVEVRQMEFEAVDAIVDAYLKEGK